MQMSAMSAMVWPGGCRLAAIFLSLALSLLAISPVRAQVTVEQYLDWRQGVRDEDRSRIETMRIFLQGMLDGLKSLAAAYERAGVKPVICLPQDAPPKIGVLMAAIDEGLLTRSYKNEDWIIVAASRGLRKSYPCK
jgi:hypothetical protein